MTSVRARTGKLKESLRLLTTFPLGKITERQVDGIFLDIAAEVIDISLEVDLDV